MDPEQLIADDDQRGSADLEISLRTEARLINLVEQADALGRHVGLQANESIVESVGAANAQDALQRPKTPYLALPNRNSQRMPERMADLDELIRDMERPLCWRLRL